MAAYEILLLNTAIPQIQAAQSGDTYLVPRDIAFSAALTLSAGTANGVPYLNASKVLTTGSALTFDGTNTLRINGSSAGYLKGPSGEILIGEDAAAVYVGTGAGVATAIPINFGSTGTTYQRWQAGGSEQMRLTSTGLGIGTSSPAYKLDVSGAAQIGGASPILYVNDGTINYRVIPTAGAAYVGTISNHPVIFQTNNGTQATLDTSGNLGLGVTPSAWASTYRALEGAFGQTWFYSNTALETGLSSNATKNGANWVYKTANAAYRYETGNLGHAWFTAPSGTANTTTITNGVSYTIITSGNQTAFGAANNNVGTSFTANASGTLSSGTVSQNISFTQAMTLDASGKLLVGTTTSPNQQTVIYRTSATTSNGALLLDGNGNYAGIQFAESGNLRASLAVDNSALYLTHESVLTFRTGSTANVGGTERARITSGGDFQTSSGNSVMVGGTAARATTAGTNRVDIFDGTAPVGTLANGVSFYSASGEANVMDAAGNATLLSPHDAETNEWIFRSKHTPTGKVLKIDVERLLKFVNDHFGLDAVHEFVEK